MLTLIIRFSCQVLTYLLITGEEAAQMQLGDSPPLPLQESHQQKEPHKLLYNKDYIESAVSFLDPTHWRRGVLFPSYYFNRL
jgi:hypothetical protein